MKPRFTSSAAAFLAAAALFTLQAAPVRADSILNFGFDNSPSVTATAGGGSTTITTTGGDQAVTISLLNGVAANIAAYLNLSATSVGAAVAAFPSGDPTQRFNGSFTITSGTGGSGTNYLSGSFTNVVFDSFLSGSGNAATLKATDPTATLTYTSDVITSLLPPSAMNFSFTNVTPGLSIVGLPGFETIGSFTASGSGTFSASPVPEPSTMAIAGLGALGFIGYGLRRRKATAA